MSRCARPVVLSILLALVAAEALAQGGGGATGRLTGRVLDASGSVLPGVTVTATSPALMGAQTAVTNAEGSYRFPSLPVGEYALSFELAGFASQVREGIRVTIGFTGTVDVTLGVQALEETVTVSGESPVVDTAATRVQTNYTQDALSSLPNARDMWSLLSTTPSVMLNRVDVGGSTAGTQTTYFAYGYSGQNRPLIEGINTTEGTSAAGFYLDYGSFEEVFIGAAANSAEMPVPGVLTQFVGKSGSNRFTPGLYYDYEHESIQGRNLTPEQVEPRPGVLAFRNDEANRLAGYYNLNVDLGGPLLRDRLWYYGAYMRQQNQVAQPPSGQIRDGTIFRTLLFNYTGKATYQLSPNDKFIGYVQHGTKQQPNRTDPALTITPIHLTADSTLNQNSPSWVWKGEYNRTFGSSGFLEARYGGFGYNFAMVNNTDAPRFEDRTTFEVTGGGRDWLLKRRRNQLTSAYSWFADDLIAGTHNFKVGLEYQRETGNTIWNSGYADQVVHILDRGAPVQVRLYATPVSSQNGLANTSLFITDSWQIRRLTLNVGARYDRYRVFLPAQSHPAGRFTPAAQDFAAVDSVVTFNEIVPRVGVIVDLFGDARTLLKANWGRYAYNPGVNLADSVNPNTSDQYALYSWADANGDRLFQPGEQTTLVQRFGGVANAAIDGGLENAYTNEFSVWGEREIITNLGARAGFVYKKDHRGYQTMNALRPFGIYTLNVTRPDPGPDGVAGTADDGAPLSLVDIPTPIPGTSNVTRNVPGYEGDYRTLEFSVNKRYANRWSLSASFSHTWTHEFARSYFGQSFGNATTGNTFFGGFPTTPNDRTENEFTNWNAKISGTVDAGWGLMVTPVLKHQSGAPWGRVVTATLNYGSQAVLVEPIGTRRQDNITVVDVRVEKRILLPVLGSTARMGLFFDVFNLMNANTAININWQSGPRFQFPVTVLPPRIAKFGVKLNF